MCSLHQVDLARTFADRIVALRDGTIVFDGPPDAFDPSASGAVVYGSRTARHTPAPLGPRPLPNFALEAA